MQFRTIVIDDEPLARQVIREFLQDFPQIEIVAECENGRQAVAAINQHKPDLIFLDVQMPGLNGLQVLEQIEHMPAIIFSTAYDEYAIRAFEVNAVDYLLKPFDRQRFATAVQRAIERRTGLGADMERLLRLLQHAQLSGTFPDRLLVRSGERIIPVRVAEIEWIEAADDYTMLHVGSAKHLCNLGLSEIEKRLNPQQFMRVHRSAIINVSRIRHLEKDGEGGMIATMMSGEEVKVSRRHAAAVRGLVV
ncbi:MAG: LytTR family DNA-binding domain-containing protein [candidate division KSB1 bacterium]|nr:LytTR family DNA-binding domain-containing protein [candidate division KSB1 bacterium]MDZ7304521.1 LytTR family DNA-binding domain-containing protein [candidate division KSB1 bacterium]